MSEQLVQKTSGEGDVVNTPSGAPLIGPAAHPTKNTLWRTRITWTEDPRPTTTDDGPRTLDPYWEITEYTTEQFNAFLEVDRLSPELAERYKDYLED
jgi:hypothetical protein